MSDIQLIHGDSLEELGWLDDNSIDAVVTDPPYGLGKEPDALEMLKDWITTGSHAVTGKGFMGKKWDAFVPQPALWKEVYRVLKPGGHVAAFFGSRTHDVGTLAIRIAGFEIRDQLDWLYFSGFPKGRNISKGIDSEKGLSDQRGRVATQGGREGGLGITSGKYNGTQLSDESVSDEAKYWDGWNTQLKPAHEPICLARKPISESTLVKNVLKWGTGAINIGGCRIGEEQFASHGEGKGDVNRTVGMRPIGKGENPRTGRWPTNIIHDGSDELEAEFAKYGDVGGGNGEASFVIGMRGTDGRNFGGAKSGAMVQSYDDTGTASRFFYAAKSCEADRNLGSNPEIRNMHPTVKPISLMRWLCRLITPKGGTVLDPFLGSGTTGVAATVELFKFLGIELEAESYAVAHSRITGVRLDDPQYDIDRIKVKGAIQSSFFDQPK